MYPGEHEGIVAEAVFERVQQMLAQNRPSASSRRYHHRHEAMLEGLVHCAACASPMGHHYTAKGTRRYRYYVCLRAQRDGPEHCPCPSIPAAELEQWAVETVVGKEDAASLTPRQQRQLIQWAVERVEYDGVSGQLTMRMRGPEARQHHVRVHFRTGGAGKKEIHGSAAPENGSLVRQRVPRVARLVALAIRFEQLVRDGELGDYAQLARLGHVTRARLSQIMSLALLAPDIQEAILLLPATDTGTDLIIERHLRPLAAEPDWARQRELFSKLPSAQS